MANDDQIIEKIQKLMALAERAGSKEEAELAFTRAQELRTRYAISELALELGRFGQREPIESETVTVGTDRSVQELLWDVAVVNNCQCLYIYTVVQARNGKYRQRHDKIEIWGRRSDIEFSKLLFTSLRMHCEHTLLIAREVNPKRYGGKSAGYSFRIGFHDGVMKKLRDARRNVIHEQSDVPGTELVLQSERDRILALMYAASPVTEKRGGLVGASHGAAYGSGFRSGQQADTSGGRNNLRERPSIAG